MNSHSTLVKTLSEKLPTTHPTLLLGPLAIAAWMLVPGLAPDDVAHPVAPKTFHGAWDAARNALTGHKSVGDAPSANANVPAGTTPGGAGVVVSNQPVLTATPQVIVLPGRSQPSAPAPAANPLASRRPTPGSNYGVRSSASANTAQPQTQTRNAPFTPAGAPAPEPPRITQPLVMTPPVFLRPPVAFPRPFMPGLAYRRPMMGRPGVTSFGGRRR
jgi:hypothetical protein